MKWYKKDLRPQGDIGKTYTANGEMVVLLRNNTGELFCGKIKNELDEKWCLIEEGWEKADVTKGVILALHKRNGKLAIFTCGESGECLGGWLEENGKSQVQWENLEGFIGNQMIVCERCSGGIEVFRLDFAAKLWHLWTDKDGKWSKWQCLDGKVGTEISVANNHEGFPEIFLKDESNSLWTRRHHDDGMWGEWKLLKKSIKKFVSIQEDDGKIRLFVVSTSGKVLTRKQKNELDEWGEWETLPVEGGKEIAVTKENNGKSKIFIMCYDNSVIQCVSREEWKIDKIEKNEMAKILGIENINSEIFCIAIGKDGYLYIGKGDL